MKVTGTYIYGWLVVGFLESAHVLRDDTFVCGLFNVLDADEDFVSSLLSETCTQLPDDSIQFSFESIRRQ